jgi:hypothetical protein
MSAEEINKNKFEKLYILRHKLDKEIGYNYWKKYVASAFWSQISTPINLTITFLTAVTTAQSQSENLLSQSIYSQIAITSLIITTLNTFFRPHTQYAANTEYLSKWKTLGIEFEKEYFNRMEEESIEAYKSKIEEYQKYFASLPYGGQMYPTGNIRIYAEPNYNTNGTYNSGLLRSTTLTSTGLMTANSLQVDNNIACSGFIGLGNSNPAYSFDMIGNMNMFDRK